MTLLPLPFSRGLCTGQSRRAFYTVLRRVPACRLTSPASASQGRRQASTEVSTRKHPHSTTPSERYGQPLHGSHPHLIASGELTPGIQASEYADRRKNLMDSLPHGSVVLSTAAQLKYMSGQIFYKFRQASNFWYLTGIEEQDSAVILVKTSDAKGYQTHLFMKERDSHDELWNGPRTGVHQSRDIFGADEVFNIKRLAAVFRLHAKNAHFVYADVSTHVPKSDYAAVMEMLDSGSTRSLSSELAKFRKTKTPAECALMRRAADVSGTAHAKTMRFGQQARSEAQLAAHFEYLCALQGSQRPAYVPVVASGANALIIHYTNNDCLLKEGELVLMDAGCELNGYASDITRTYPVSPSGQFTPPQKELYSAVLGVQKSLILLCTEDSHESLNSLHAKSVELLGKALSQIGFDLGVGNRRLDRLYPHFLSHPIGIDLHETSMERHQYLVEGQVITIEPGVYVPPDPTFPKWFHNIGIRIEDEVLVGRTESQILSVNAPKEVVDIEATCQGLLDVGPY